MKDPKGQLTQKYFRSLNVRPETIKLLEEKIGRTLDDINQSKILYDPPPRVMVIKTIQDMKTTSLQNKKKEKESRENH